MERVCHGPRGMARHAVMIERRLLLGGVATLLAACSPEANSANQIPAPEVPPAYVPVSGQSFERFLDGVRADARRAGVSDATLNQSFVGLKPNQRVIELDRRQAEGGMQWEDYRDRIMLTPTRIQNGRRLMAENTDLLRRIEARYHVAPSVIVAIWGVETNYGGNTGGFGVVEALATLAWEGRRAAYFRNELMSALRILNDRHISADRMKGSWAGAMGQPQFMPSNFERLAVDFDGDGRRDIWDNRADALASIAHYFQRNGWRHGEAWGREVRPPAGFTASGADTESKRPLRDFARMGFRKADGSPLPSSDIETQIVLPSRGNGGQIFLGHHNLRVIRRYNTPVNYGLSVGLLSDRVA
jgi:membrane-bound lytic murein transglycosylase B